MSNRIIEIKSSQHFLELIDSANSIDKNKIYVIDFYAKWCGPCKKYGDYIESNILQQGKYKSIVFAKMDIDNNECHQVISKFQVTSIPRTMILQNKIIMNDILGNNPDLLVKKLDELL